MNRPFFRNPRGITLIELLIALAIFGLVSAASYRLFVAQGRAYVVQDQVGEIQQNIRAGMELLLRDVRMAGYDSGSPTSQITVNNPIVPGTKNPVVSGTKAITVSYEYDDVTLYTIQYWRDDATSTVFRKLTTTKPDGTTVDGPDDPLLENVDLFQLSYGIDHGPSGTEDGMMDYWEPDPTKIGSRRIVAVQIRLMARPDPVNPDVQKLVSPRTLESIVALRNLTFVP